VRDGEDAQSYALMDDVVESVGGVACHAT